MRIGIFGGTFDPPHVGHLAVARAALDQLELDELIFVPASRNPIKGRNVGTPPEERLAMVEALVRGADDPKIGFSDLEVTRGGPSYTVDTISELQFAKPGDYWFVLGADALRTLSDWKQPQRLVRLCRLAIVLRHPMNREQLLARVPEEYHEKLDWIEMQPINISSSELREKMLRGQSVSNWVPPEVVKTIHTQRLYNA